MSWYVTRALHVPRIPTVSSQSETLDKSFEKPLRQHLETYRTIVHVRTFSLKLSCAFDPASDAGAVCLVREGAQREEQHHPRYREAEHESQGAKWVPTTDPSLAFFSDDRGPDLQSFRQALVVLQRQVDELDELKARHYEEILEHEEEVWDVVQGKASASPRPIKCRISQINREPKDMRRRPLDNGRI